MGKRAMITLAPVLRMNEAKFISCSILLLLYFSYTPRIQKKYIEKGEAKVCLNLERWDALTEINISYCSS